MYNGAASWLHDVKGITSQWDREIPTVEVDRLISAGDFYLGLREGAIVAGVQAARRSNFLWAGNPARAIYLHSLAVRRDLAGQGIGRQVLEWAGQHARELGRTRLRLDCMAANPQLRQYYREQGFTDLGQHPKYAWYALFEKEV